MQNIEIIQPLTPATRLAATSATNSRQMLRNQGMKEDSDIVREGLNIERHEKGGIKGADKIPQGLEIKRPAKRPANLDTAGLISEDRLYYSFHVCIYMSAE